MSPLENDDGESICEERKKMMRGTLLTVKKNHVVAVGRSRVFLSEWNQSRHRDPNLNKWRRWEILEGNRRRS